MNNASFKTEDRIAVDASARADDPNQALTESLNGNGFYRFKIGDFQATVISDGQGPNSGQAGLRHERLRS
jgi:hypothetical protein